MINKNGLIVIDMQNSFLHPDGENYFSAAVKAVEPVLNLIETARKSSCLIVHTVDQHRVGLPDFEQKHLPVHCLEDDMNAGYFDQFGPGADSNLEIEIVKRRYSAFFGTDLAMTLQECGIENTIICGVKTNVCVRSTSQDAFAYGFNVFIPAIATASNRENLALASLEDIDRYFGSTIDLQAANDLLAEGMKS